MPSPAAPSPWPLPPQASSVATRRRRRRQLLPPSSSSTAPTSAAATSSSSSGSSSSSSASSGLSFFSPAPSPFHHRFLSPLRASAVPFSWEHRPGIPKTPARKEGRAGGKPAGKAAALPLPLPPSLLSSKVGAADDPFDAAGDYFIVPEDAKAARRRRRRGRQQRHRRSPALAATLSDWLAVLSLYRSCTRSRDCIAGTPAPAPRSRPRSPAKQAASRR